jgi:conjugative relaxase-like TrwC/TraI family protein
MLRINAIPDSAAGKSYYKSADYHIAGQEAPAPWHGKGAELLGLAGAIDQTDFERLCENINPQTLKQLTAKHIANRRVGYDFTFSVPKSVSVVYALGADPRLADEFRAAVAETMTEMEREMATRVRKSGMDTDRRTGNMIWADFLHHTSRPIDGVPDPQLHIHAVVFNATYDHEEGQWKAGQFGQLKADAPYFQAGFRARLANRLQELGYQIRRTKDDFEITGVPESVIKAFSRRTDLIEKTAKELGVKRPESKAKLGATTREKKTDGLTWDDLLGLWKDRLRPGDLAAVQATAKQADTPMVVEDRAKESVAWALWHTLERRSVVSERELVTTALKHGLGGVTLEGVVEEIGKRRDLIRREIGGVNLVTTQAVLNEEKAIVEFAQKGKGRWRPLSASTARAGGDRPELTTLSPTQASAVKHAWDSRDQLIMIRGAAGTGKTTLTKALLAGVDVPYVVLAPSAEASRGVLRREGVDARADTLAKFLGDDEMQARVRGGLIVLDEASLTGAHDLAKLLKSAEGLKARVLLLGDRRQHKSVARGDVLQLLEDKAKLKVATVGEIRRQSGDYKAAVKLASEGRVADAFKKLDDLKWIKEGHDALVEDYIDAVRTKRPDQSVHDRVIVVAPTHAEGDTVTAKLRERLKAEGVIHGPEKEITRLENVSLTEAEKGNAETLRAHAGETAQYVRHGKSARAGDRVTITAENTEALAKEGGRFVVYRPVEMKLAAGDTVRMTGNGWDVTGSHRLNNGAVYGVAAVTDAGVKLDNGWMIDTPHLQHGLVVTSHAAQGRTVDKVLIAQSSQSFPASDKAQFYVSVSRARHQATIFTDDKAALLEAVDRDRSRMLASELVRVPKRQLGKKKKRALAWMRDLVERFKREPEHEKRQERNVGRERDQ